MCRDTTNSYRGALIEEYLAVADQLLDCGELTPAVECVATVLHIDDGNPDALELLSMAAATERPAPAQDRGGTRRRALLMRKRQLDRAYQQDRGVADCSWLSAELQTPNAGAAANTNALPPEVRRELASTVQKLRSSLAKDHPGVVDELEQMCDHFEVDPDEQAEGDALSFAWPLSAEHEIHNLGNSIYKAAHFDEAYRCYSMALRINPDLLETWFNRALALTRLQRYPEARADLEQVIEMNPNLAEAYYTLGLVYEYEVEYAKAIEQYVRAIDVDNSYEKARLQLDVAKNKLEAQNSSSSSSSSSDSEDYQEIRDFTPFIEHPDCGFDEVAGCERAKQELLKIVACVDEDRRGVMRKWGVELAGGVLLWGPPGVGKTLLARAVAGEVKCPFFAVPASKILSMWAGQSEKNLANLWEQASQYENAVIYLPEFDSIGGRRTDMRDPGAEHWTNRMVSCLLDLTEGLRGRPEGLILIGDTNLPSNVDEALIRPGRFKPIEVTPPATTRDWAEVWLIHLARTEGRAELLDLLAGDLRAPLRADRKQWLDEAFTSGSPGTSEIAELANFSRRAGFVPADVPNVLRRVVDERAMMEMRDGVNLGSITVLDLIRHCEEYAEDRLRLRNRGLDRPFPGSGASPAAT